VKKALRHLYLTALAGLVGLTSSVSADYIVTLDGKRIEGTITNVTEDEIKLNTKYGDLTFLIKNLSDYGPKTGGAAAPSNNTGAGSTGGFGGNQPSSGSNNPFAPTQPTNNPFAPNSGSTGSSGNTFGGSNSAPSNNPFAPNAGSTNNSSVFSQPVTPTANQPAEVQLSLSDLDPRPNIEVPSVPIAWDGVLFDIENVDELDINPPSNIRQSAENEEDYYYYNNTLITTGNTKVRAALKNGRDMIRVNPRSQYVLRQASEELNLIELNRGSLWFDLKPVFDEDRRVVIQTQTTEVIAENGSVFRVSDALEQGIQISVISGQVEVLSRVAQVGRIVTSGDMVLVQPEGSITDLAINDITTQYENKGWETLDVDWFITRSRTSGESRTLISRNELDGRLREVVSAFLNYTKDTGHIPTPTDGFSVLLENTADKSGWDGPYMTGVVPPIDCWGRPLRYTTVASDNSNLPIGVVYSLGADAFDNKGDSSADVTEMVLFFQVTTASAN